MISNNEIVAILQEQIEDTLLSTVKKFAETLQAKVKAYYEDEKFSPSIDWSKYYTVKIKAGKRWIKIDVGTSGKFMLDTTNHHLYYIKGYGVPDTKKDFGDIFKIVEAGFDWDGFSIVKKGSHIRSRYGYAGVIAEEENHPENVMFLFLKNRKSIEVETLPLKGLPMKTFTIVPHMSDAVNNFDIIENGKKVKKGIILKDHELKNWLAGLKFIKIVNNPIKKPAHKITESEAYTKQMFKGMNDKAKEMHRKYINNNYFIPSRGVYDRALNSNDFLELEALYKIHRNDIKYVMGSGHTIIYLPNQYKQYETGSYFDKLGLHESIDLAKIIKEKLFNFSPSYNIQLSSDNKTWDIRKYHLRNPNNETGILVKSGFANPNLAMGWLEHHRNVDKEDITIVPSAKKMAMTNLKTKWGKVATVSEGINKIIIDKLKRYGLKILSANTKHIQAMFKNKYKLWINAEHVIKSTFDLVMNKLEELENTAIKLYVDTIEGEVIMDADIEKVCNKLFPGNPDAIEFAFRTIRNIIADMDVKKIIGQIEEI